MPIILSFAPLVLALIPLLPPSPTARFSNTAILVIDSSGSMKPSVKQAMKAFGEITRQPSDGYRIKVLVWAQRSKWYRKDWIKLPDNLALADTEAWIKKTDVGENTMLHPALKKAITKAPKKCTVIVVSDFETYFERVDQIRAVVKTRPDITWAAVQIRNDKLKASAKAVGAGSGGVFFSR